MKEVIILPHVYSFKVCEKSREPLGLAFMLLVSYGISMYGDLECFVKSQ